MKPGKDSLLMTAAMMLLLVSFSRAQAQFGAGEPFGTEASNGDVAVIYLAVYGRTPQPGEFVAARDAGFDNNQALSASQKVALTQMLKKHLRAADGEQDLRNVITRSHRHAFGREPKTDEMKKWFALINGNQMDYGYTELMNAHRAYLKTPNSFADRAWAITHGYLDAMGRAPNPGDMDYWKGRMASDGSTYRDVLVAAIEWIKGNSAEQILECSETIKRAFARANKPEPSTAQIAQIRTKLQSRHLNFQQLIDLVKKGV